MIHGRPRPPVATHTLTEMQRQIIAIALAELVRQNETAAPMIRDAAVDAGRALGVNDLEQWTIPNTLRRGGGL